MLKKLCGIIIIIGVILMPVKNIFISDETDKFLTDTIFDIISKYSTLYKIEEALIKAIIKVESNFYPFAFRVDYEVLKNKSWYLNILKGEEKNKKEYYASYGLMQILYGTAKELGYKGEPYNLFNPEENIKYGCSLLKRLLDKYKDIKDVISSYNAGSPQKKDGKYINNLYVEEVYKIYKTLGGKL